jgi:mono/diheme cytochrome c family protein
MPREQRKQVRRQVRPEQAGRLPAVVSLLVLVLIAFSGCGKEKTQGAPVGRVLMGRALFEAKCSFCHYVDREETKIGPGLKGVLAKASLPASGRPATPDNIRSQLGSPVGKMPAFASLSEQELADLLAYLKTL